MPDAHKNFAASLVATAPSPATSGTSLVVTAADGAKFPAAPFNATVWPAGAQPTTANAEIVRVTVKSTDTFTITRAQESSSARTIVVGDQIAATITAKTLTDIETESLDVIAAANATAADWSNNNHKITNLAAATAAADAVQFIQVTQRVGKASDQTQSSNTTLTPDTALLFAIGASATEAWFFEALLFITAPNATMDVKFGWTVPTAATMQWGFLPAAGSAQPGFTSLTTGGTITANLTAGSSLAVGTGNANEMIALAGWVFGGGNAGNVTLTWAQNTSDLGTLTMKAGSLMRFARVNP